MALSLHESIAVGQLRRQFAEKGRIEISPFLGGASADLLRRHLVKRKDWRVVLNAGNKVFEISRSDWEKMARDQRKTIERMVTERAQAQFQYRFQSIRVADDAGGRSASGTILDAFAQFMSSSEVLGLLKEITGFDDLTFADAQATWYGTGDFLTRHDDDVAGKNRRAAYVLGLNPRWRAEWGGLLMFHGKDEEIGDVFVPAMGALRLFRVPVQHSVTYVSPIAPEPRVAITGWLRTVAPEQPSENQASS